MRFIALIASTQLAFACGPGANHSTADRTTLPIAEAKVDLTSIELPDASYARSSLKYQALFYVNNASWTSDETAPLGAVFVIDPDVSNNCDPKTMTGTLIQTEHRIPASFTDPSTPEKLKSIVVNRTVAGQLSILDFMSTSFDDQAVASVIMTNAPRRIRDDTKFSAERDKWRAANTAFLSDQNHCYVGIAYGVAKRAVVSRIFRETHAEAQGGVYGINVNGKYYTSNEDYEVNYLFGLDFVWLKRPPSSQSPGPTPAAATAADERAFENVTKFRLLRAN